MFKKTLLSVGVAGAIGLMCVPVLAGPLVQNRAVEIVGAGAAADPLIAVEANRAAIVNRLAVEHSDTLAAAGVSQEAFRHALRSLRADQLLAASLVSTVEEISAIVSQSPANGSALQRFIALTPMEATSMAQLPVAEAYLVRDGETLTILKASRLQLGTPGVQLVGYFAPATSGVAVSSSAAAAFTAKDGSGSGANSWIGYTAGGNSASGSGSAVAAGTFNSASGTNSFVGAGSFNSASGLNSFVGAGQSNSADGISSLVIGGFDNHATVIDSTVVAGAGNRATGARSVVVGGGYNLARGQWSFIGGGGRQNGSGNAGTSGEDHIAAGDFSSIGGGQGNHAGAVSNAYATVSGGQFNTASGAHSAVVGGGFNTASGARSSVLGGLDNIASGRDSIAAGCGATASNPGSIVIAATAVNPCASDFFFNSTTDNEFAVRATGGARIVTAVSGTTPTRTVKINASGDIDFSVNPFDQHLIFPGVANGIGAQTNSVYTRVFDGAYWYAQGVHSSTEGDPGAGGTVLASLTTGSGATPAVTGTFRAQVITPTSDRDQKTAFETLSPKSILAKVAALPITFWSFKNEASSGVRHIGPVAQDFMRLFNVGYDDKSIATVDADGVALAAIQGLYAEAQERGARIDLQQAALDAQRTQIAAQQRRIAALEQQIGELAATHLQLQDVALLVSKLQQEVAQLRQMRDVALATK